MNGKEIYQLASEITEQEFNNLFNLFTEKEEDLFNSFVRLGDSKEVALWTVISERYAVENGNELYNIAYKS